MARTEKDYEDGEIIGWESGPGTGLFDRYFIQWNGDDKSKYCSQETMEEFGLHNLHDHEVTLLGFEPGDVAIASEFYAETKCGIGAAELERRKASASKPGI